jgi:hypothetical protein
VLRESGDLSISPGLNVEVDLLDLEDMVGAIVKEGMFCLQDFNIILTIHIVEVQPIANLEQLPSSQFQTKDLSTQRSAIKKGLFPSMNESPRPRPLLLLRRRLSSNRKSGSLVYSPGTQSTSSIGSLVGSTQVQTLAAYSDPVGPVAYGIAGSNVRGTGDLTAIPAALISCLRRLS